MDAVVVVRGKSLVAVFFCVRRYDCDVDDASATGNSKTFPTKAAVDDSQDHTVSLSGKTFIIWQAGRQEAAYS